jgi:hypothetical protein
MDKDLGGLLNRLWKRYKAVKSSLLFLWKETIEMKKNVGG